MFIYYTYVRLLSLLRVTLLYQGIITAIYPISTRVSLLQNTFLIPGYYNCEILSWYQGVITTRYPHIQGCYYHNIPSYTRVLLPQYTILYQGINTARYPLRTEIYGRKPWHCG